MHFIHRTNWSKLIHSLNLFSHLLTISPMKQFHVIIHPSHVTNTHPLSSPPTHFSTHSLLHPLTSPPTHFSTHSVLHPLTCPPTHFSTHSLLHPLSSPRTHFSTHSVLHALTSPPTFHPSSNVQVAVLINSSKISRSQEALWGEHLCRLFQVIQVSHKHISPLDNNLIRCV